MPTPVQEYEALKQRNNESRMQEFQVSQAEVSAVAKRVRKLYQPQAGRGYKAIAKAIGVRPTEVARLICEKQVPVKQETWLKIKTAVQSPLF